MGFSTLDYIVFAIYCLIILFIGLYVSNRKKDKDKTANDYFLASSSLTWWAIGASLIAANISAEHFIAMSGSGYAIGLGIAAYEWIAAVALILVAKYFLPIFLEKKIYTMPQFVNDRFSRLVGSLFAGFWILVYIFVNLTSVSYLGALAMEKIMGVPLLYGIIGLLLFSGIYSIYGGLSSVAWTDVIQVTFLIGGGLVTTFISLNVVGGGDVLKGLGHIYEGARDHFSMIVSKGAMSIPDGAGGMKDAYNDLPGLAVILGSMWLINLGYWGFNQYIIQKGLAGKTLQEAKKGLIFAGYLKILIPLLVVIPGITAYVISNNPGLAADTVGEITKSDEAYPWLLQNFVPVGVRGLAFAALVAAVVSSLASMINSTSTVFTMDIYKAYIRPNANDKELIRSGRTIAVVAMLIAIVVAPALKTLDQVFQYIQMVTGFVYPGVVVVFGLGLFWTQITNKAALYTAILTLPTGVFFYLILPGTPFILRMGYVFMILCIVALTTSFLDKGGKVASPVIDGAKKKKMLRSGYLLLGIGILLLLCGVFLSTPLADFGFEAIFVLGTLFLMLGIVIYTNATMEVQDAKAIVVKSEIFITNRAFNMGAIGILVIIVTLYSIFWM
ncbi:MAG: sodium/solute symporter [Cytophagales bacterium]|nr:sodium/solute symporter [Cytophagales bacterium]